MSFNVGDKSTTEGLDTLKDIDQSIEEKQAKGCEQPPTMDGTCILQEVEGAKSANATKDTDDACCLSTKIIAESNEITMENGRGGQDEPDPVIKIEFMENPTNVEGEVTGSNKASQVVLNTNLCETPAPGPCLLTLPSGETTPNITFKTDTTSNEAMWLQELIGMDQKKSYDEEIVYPTAFEEPVDSTQVGPATMSDNLEESDEKLGTFISESEILVKSNDIYFPTKVPPEPIISVANVNSLTEHRGAVVPYSDTDDSDCSSSSSGCDDSSDESSESETSSSDSDDEVQSTAPVKKSSISAKPIKEKGELDIDDLPPIQDLHISVRNDEVVEIGKVLHAVDTLVVVEGLKDLPPLDIDSILFLDRGARPLGRVFDVMGPVTEPLYCVRFNSKEHIEEHNIQSGMLVYCAPQTEHSNFVFLQHLLMMKGSDASWKKDKEVPVDCLDFSDDEEEAKLRKMQRPKKAEQSRNFDGPKPKNSRVDNQSSHRPTPVQQSGHQNSGRNDGFRPRNPWGWSGARTQGYRNQNGTAVPTHQEQSHSRGSVRPSSFNTDFSYLQFPRNHESEPFRYPSASQFGRGPSPRMFGQPQTTPAGSGPPSWCSTAKQPHSQHNDMNPGSCASFQQEGNNYPSMPYEPSSVMHCSGANSEDQRYHAFQSEIARLVDAYNKGAEAPSAVPPMHFGGRQSVRPHFPTLQPRGGEASAAVPPPFHARGQPIPSHFPPPSYPPPSYPPPPTRHPSSSHPPHHSNGPNFSHQHNYQGQW